jgi:hypothetical protein
LSNDIRKRYTHEDSARSRQGIQPSISETNESQVGLDHVRELKLKYDRRTSGKVDLIVEYIDDRGRVFVVEGS